MKLLHSLLHRQIVRSYSAKDRHVDVDFVLEGMKSHKDDNHEVKGPDTQAEVPPFACSFNKSLLRGHMLAVADEEGGVCLYDVRRQGPSAKLKAWVAHSNAIFDIAWVCNEPKLVTASGDQTAQLWDIQQSTRLAIFKGHSCSLKSVDFQEENLFVFATGARDGNIMIWDLRCNKRDGYYKPVNTIHNCHSTLANGTPQRMRKRGQRLSNVITPDSQQSVTSVKFQNVNTVISAGAVDGNIKVWDLRKNYSTIRTEAIPYHVFPYPETSSRKHGYSSLTIDSTKSRLFANCTNNMIYMYDCITYPKHPQATFKGHSNATFYVKSCISPDDQYLMSGSGDSDGYIWRITDPNAAPFHLTGHTNEVTCVAWCPTDQCKAVTCSDDNSVKFWRVNFQKKQDGDFVGWCERKPNPPLPMEAKDELAYNSTTPNTSPVRSRSSSTTSSPVSQSPNPSKCSSPQQFLQNWLQSSNVNSPRGAMIPGGSKKMESSSNKRPREHDTTHENKRVCLEESMETDSADDKMAACNVKSAKLDKIDSAKDSNKENMNNLNEQVKTEQSSVGNTGLLLCPKPLSERQTNTEHNSFCSNQINQSDCKSTVTKQDGKKSNWLRDMGVKKRSVNGKVSRKVHGSPSQLNSPLQEPSSPNTDVCAVLKNTRSIKDYFAPKSSDSSLESKCSQR